MRITILLAALAVSGCGQVQIGGPLNKSKITGGLSLERSHTKFVVSDQKIDSDIKVSLVNTDFGTARRIERSLDNATLNKDTVAPDLAMIELAKEAAQEIYPDVELKFINLRKGARYEYVSFQQTHLGLEVHGARLVMRMTPQGEWSTLSSTFVSPSLLPTELAPSKNISTSDYFSEMHSVIDEIKVFYPRKDDKGTVQIHQARQIVVFSMENHYEYWLWVDEVSGKAVGAYNPASHLEDVKVVGTIVPNKPEDKPVQAVFPGVTAILQGAKTIQATNKGTFNRLDLIGKLGSISLENSFVTVSNAKSSESKHAFDFSKTEAGDISLEKLPTLEERNIYYWIMKARDHLINELNYKGMDYQLLAVANYGEDFDNAFFMPLTKSLSFGKGKKFLKNTSLSRDIILHEYGHAVTHSIYGLSSGYEFSAMNEAMSDYLAATITGNPEIAEGAMQESTNMPHLRTVNNDMVYPHDFKGNRFHEDGQMFGGALWDLRQALGAKKADLMIHEARLAQAKSVYEFYLELLKIDEDLDDHNPLTRSPNHGRIRAAFHRHGIGHRDVRFDQAETEDLTEPWKIPDQSLGCWTAY